MIPQGGTLTNNINMKQQSGHTYRLDFASQRISGMCDGLEAVKQAVYKILQTNRFEHLIYSFNYGSELRSMIGSDPLYVQSELARTIREALLQDDRITSIENMRVEFAGENTIVQFDVVSQYGRFQVEEVT